MQLTADIVAGAMRLVVSTASAKPTPAAAKLRVDFSSQGFADDYGSPVPEITHAGRLL